MKLLFIYIFVLFQNQSLLAKKYPSNLPRCFRDDPNLSDCIIKATETLRPKIKKDGIVEFRLPPMNPYTIPFASFEQGSQAVNFNTSVTNFSIYGLDDYKFEEFSINPNTFNMHAIISCGPLQASGECKFNGRLLMAPINGKGTLIIDTVPPTFTIDVNAELITRKTMKYIQINSAAVHVENFGGKARFENFEGANENIVTAINRVMDENSDELLKEVKSLIVNFLSSFVIITLGEIFNKYPLNEILPSSS